MNEYSVRVFCLMIEHLRRMAIFAKTIEHGSFRAAARELNLSPSVVSQHVSHLEAHLGATLVLRSTRELALTNEGQKVFDAASRMLSAVRDDLASATQKDLTSELRITVPSVLSASHLTDALTVIARKHPEIRLNLDYTDERKALVADQFDLAVRMSLTKKQRENTLALFKVDRILVASRAYLMRIPDVTKVDDLSDVRFLILERLKNAPIQFKHRDGRAATLRPNVAIGSNHAQGLYQMVCGGLGVAVLPIFLSAKDIKSGDVVRVLPEWSLPPAYAYLEWSAKAPPNSLALNISSEISKMCLADI